MDLAYWIEVGLLLLLSIVKFLLTPSTMIIREWTFVETVVISSSGAALGCFIFYHLGDMFFKWLQARRRGDVKLFSWKNRQLVKIKSRFGIRGLMMISGLISVPITAVLAARYFKSDTALPSIIMGFFIWSILLTSLSVGFDALVGIFGD